MRVAVETDLVQRTVDRPPGPEDGLPARLTRIIDLFPTRRAAAAAAGVSVDQIARYMAGTSAPPFAVVARLAAAQGVSLDWVATGTGPTRNAAAAAGTGLEVQGLVPAPEAGWYAAAPLAVRLPALPGASPSATIAVMAPDNALKAAGIVAGHVCFCVVGSPLVQGDVAFVRRADGRAALRTVREATEDELRLEAPDGGTESLSHAELSLVAAVLQVRRKW